MDIESDANHMIQARARCRLVSSFPAYYVKLLTATLRTVWVTRLESKAFLCVIYAKRHALPYYGDFCVKSHKQSLHSSYSEYLE